MNANTTTTINVTGVGDSNAVAQRVAGAQVGISQQAINDAANALANGTE
ncbi:MAG: hypothetical protein KF764_25535 [Labilithrix sp.]|nr:hypothetical protein [Labilithrix sp.]